MQEANVHTKNTNQVRILHLVAFLLNPIVTFQKLIVRHLLSIEFTCFREWSGGRRLHRFHSPN